MNKNYIITLLFTICISAVSLSQVIKTEDFSYPDGSIVANSAWVQTTATAGVFLVANGEAIVSNGTDAVPKGGDDVRITFAAVTGDLHAGFDFTVEDFGTPYTGTDNEYFAHFNFSARIFIVPALSGGDYTIGISSGNANIEATWPTDLVYGTKYRVVLKYDQVTHRAQFWVSPTSDASTSISGFFDNITPVTSFDLRQTNSSVGETIKVDNLMVGQQFNDVLVFPGTASVKDNNIEGFATYPNPITNNKFTVATASISNKIVTVFNLLGKKVLTTNFSGNKFTIDVSSINAGVYILKVIEDGKSATKKLVIR